MWYQAVECSSESQSERIYKPLFEAMKPFNIDLSVFRIVLAGKWLVLVIAAATPPHNVQKLASKYLSQGKAVTLANDVLTGLLERRDLNIAHANPRPGKPGYAFESHTPTPLPYGNANYDQANVDVTQTELELWLDGRRKEATEIRSHAIGLPGSKPGDITPVTIKTIPFIVAYSDLSGIRDTRKIQTAVSQAYPNQVQAITNEALAMFGYINQVNAAKLRRAKKYLFTPSANAMHRAVFQPGFMWIDQATHVWLELQTPIDTPYGHNIRAVYLHNACPITEVDQVMPVGKNKQQHDILVDTFSTHKAQWSLNIIDVRADNIYDFTFDLVSQQWVYLSSHICPYGACIYPKRLNLANLGHDEIVACDQCKAACIYWSSWCYTALRMINRDFATSATPDETQPYPTETQPYQVDTLVSVGKGKNKRKIQQTVTRNVEYRLIKYDVSLVAPTKAPTEKPGDTRANWLTLADKNTIIYQKRTIAAYQRRFPHKTTSYQVASHSKYVPMLAKEVRTFKKIVASTYQEHQ